MHALLGASPQRSFNLQLPQKVKDKLVQKEENKGKESQEHMVQTRNIRHLELFFDSVDGFLDNIQGFIELFYEEDQ